MVGPRNKKEGYLLVDHRAGAGMTEAEARMAGYDPAMVRAGKVYEVATLTCAHCRGAVVKNPMRTRERHTCAKCNFHYVCDLCAANMELADYQHLPFEKMADMAFAGKQPAFVAKSDLHAPAQLILPPHMGGRVHQIFNGTAMVPAGL